MLFIAFSLEINSRIKIKISLLVHFFDADGQINYYENCTGKEGAEETKEVNPFHCRFQTFFSVSQCNVRFLPLVLYGYQKKAILHDCHEDWYLHSNVPHFQESKTPEFWSIHGSINSSLDQKDCDQHPHSSRNHFRFDKVRNQ